MILSVYTDSPHLFKTFKLHSPSFTCRDQSLGNYNVIFQGPVNWFALAVDKTSQIDSSV